MMEKYNIAEPWLSNGLTPVEITYNRQLPPLVVLNQGMAAVDIIVPAKTEHDKYYRQVAVLLQDYLQQATGVTFKLTTVPVREQNIFIGACNNSEIARLKQASNLQGDESFTIASISAGIVLLGNDSDCPVHKFGELDMFNPKQNRGTYFAVVDFLERLLGFRFYFPGKLGTHIPTLTGSTVTIPALSYTDQPIYELRLSSYPNYKFMDYEALQVDYNAMLRWDRLQRSGDIRMEMSGHTDNYWHEIYGNEHPEWFALRKDGSRMLGQGETWGHRCYSCDAGFKEHLRLIEQALAGDYNGRAFGDFPPNEKFIYWMPNDGFTGCHCAECQPLIDLDVPTSHTYVRLIWSYILKLSAAIKERWPDKILKVALYNGYGALPENVEVPDNVAFFVVKLGSWRIGMAYLKEPKYWDNAMAELEYFKSRVKHKPFIWSHYPHSPRVMNSVNMPYPIPHYYKEFLDLNRDKIVGIYQNATEHISFALDGFMIYCQFRLLWNPNFNVDAALKEYTAVLWGPTADNIYKYYTTIIERWENTRWDNLPEGPNIGYKIPVKSFINTTFPQSILEQLEQWINMADNLVSADSIYSQRCNYLKDNLQTFFIQARNLSKMKKVTAGCPQFTPTIDANLSKWQKFQPLTMIDNKTAAPANAETLIYTAYDNCNFYIAGEISEPDGLSLNGKKLPRNSALWHQESIEIFLATEQDGHKEAGFSNILQYHHIIIDPYGSIFDGYKAYNKEQADNTINIDFSLATAVTEQGYCFEMAIPFTSLHCLVPTPGTEWRVDFFRNRFSQNHTERYSWVITNGSNHKPESYGHLIFKN